MNQKYNCAWAKAIKNIKIGPMPFTRIYTWWWQSGVGYQKAGELARENYKAKLRRGWFFE